MTIFVDEYYSGLIASLIENGVRVKGRNGYVTTSTNPLVAAFTQTPLVSVRQTAWKTALQEMEWFLSGSVDINDATDAVKKWWAPWADESGRIEGSYGKQLRGFNYRVDQVARTVQSLTNDPYSRRHVITTWNPVDMRDAPIANCHGTVIQFFVTDTGALNMSMYQRSADMIIGVPHNWIQYWAFLLWMSAVTYLEPGAFYWIGGACHIYEQHMKTAGAIAVAKNLSPASAVLTYEHSNYNFKASDFRLTGPYKPLITKSLEPVI